MPKLTKDFYLRDNVVQISKELLGKYLFAKFDGKLTGGIIAETEAYAGITDKASHAYGNRRTTRTEVMYHEGGVAYVYLCYGIHSLFNIVTNKKDLPDAVLIRAIKPTEGINVMIKRRNKKTHKLTSGPGTVAQALGMKTIHSGLNLCGNKIWLEDNGMNTLSDEIITSTRIGVAYAEEDALLPYRFQLKFF